MIEEKMLILLRQGKVSKWFSGIGQEAISAGATLALDKDEYILPLHRNLGVFTNRDIPLTKLLAQWQGKLSGFSKGRERSFHFGTNEYHIVGMISHLGAMLGVADGIALGGVLKEEKKIALVFSGDGGASEGKRVISRTFDGNVIGAVLVNIASQRCLRAGGDRLSSRCTLGVGEVMVNVAAISHRRIQ